MAETSRAAVKKVSAAIPRKNMVRPFGLGPRGSGYDAKCAKSNKLPIAQTNPRTIRIASMFSSNIC